MILDIYFLLLKKVFSWEQEQKRDLFILLFICLTAFMPGRYILCCWISSWCISCTS